MIIKLGPIVIMDSKTREAYRELLTEAYLVHQNIWFSQDWAQSEQEIKNADSHLSEAISHVPASELEI